MADERPTPHIFAERNRLLAARLRDPNSKQAFGKLRDGNAFCCLGHACEVYRLETGEGEWDGREYFLSAALVAPYEVYHWFGWTSLVGESGNPKLGIRSAASWNDDERLPLPQIADLFDALADEMEAADAD